MPKHLISLETNEEQVLGRACGSPYRLKINLFYPWDGIPGTFPTELSLSPTRCGVPADIEWFAVACAAVKAVMETYGGLVTAFLSTYSHKLLQILEDEYRLLLFFNK